jgi:hypothetical protein
MDTEKQPPSNDTAERINWHPAFIEALQMELVAYKNVLEFYPEFQLTSAPGALLRLKPSRIYNRINLYYAPRGAKLVHPHR